MTSPFTNGKSHLKTELRGFVFRKETFKILYHFYVCDDTNEQFTTDELDNLNLVQVHNKYREKHGIPFTEQIVETRKKYGLSAAKMSEVLGLGTNSYRNYESGEIPSIANGRLINLASNPGEFIKLLDISKNSIERSQYENILVKAQTALNTVPEEDLIWMTLLFGNYYPNILNGYKSPSLQKIGNMVCYFAVNNEPFTTALNKLMFYADFGHFKNYGCSISGAYYKAITRGPVLENYGGIYNHVVNAGFAKIEEMDFGEFIGERFVANGNLKNFDDLSEIELETLGKVSKKFKNLSTKEIVRLSHDELAWIDNIEEKNRISFEYSFLLKYLS